MKFFIDTAEIEEIKSLSKLGLVDGVTTNPSLIYKSGKDFKTVIKEISDIARKIEVKILLDSCQSLAHQSIDVKSLLEI